MTRLSIRKQLFLFIGLLLLSCGLVIFLPSHSPDKVIRLSFIAVVFGELIISIAVAYLCFQSAPVLQIIQAAATFLALSYGIGTVGNLTSQVNQPLGGADILISWIQLGIMNIGGLIGTYALYESSQKLSLHAGVASDVVRTVKPRESKTKAESNTEPQAQISSSNVASTTAIQVVGRKQPEVKEASVPMDLTVLQSEESIKAFALPHKKLMQIDPIKQQQIDQGKSATAITDPGLQSMQTQSLRNAGTFTKLQALSGIKGQTLPSESKTEPRKSILEELEEYIETASEPLAQEAGEEVVVNPQQGFGRLSTRSTGERKQQTRTGPLPAIDKLFIDPKAVENIARGEESTPNVRLANTRIISAARAKGISAVLKKIDSCSGVAGCLIVGHDGLVILSTADSGINKDAVGALSAALLSTSNLTTLKIEMGQLKQIVLLTEYSDSKEIRPISTILTEMQVGVLVVFSDTQQLDKLDNLLETIQTTVYG